MSTGKQVVFATFGSLGDVHPFFAIGRVLQERGHRVTLATSTFHRAKIEAEGFEFFPVRPDIAELGGPAGLLREFSGSILGPLTVVRRRIFPRLAETAADLLTIARQADFLAVHPIFYPAPMIAEKLGLPWAGAFLQPMAFFSAHDPAVLRWLPAAVHRVGVRLGRAALHPLIRPLRALRAELGLPPAKAHPMFGGQFSPQLNLALFSAHFAPPRPDWPRTLVATGFPFFDHGRSQGEQTDPALDGFLDAGPPPIVVTFGSTVVDIAAPLLRDCMAVATTLGARLVLLTGTTGRQHLPAALPPRTFAAPYAAHGALFSRAAAIVHQGGIGTTAQALRAGRPQLIVPYGFDQPDNAQRAARLGVARVLPHGRFSVPRATELLRQLCSNPDVATRARDVARLIASENGAVTAADAIERAMTMHPRR